MATLTLDRSQSHTEVADEALVDKGGKYLTFKLANEQYGVEILRVRELIGLLPITAVPQMPACMKGVINLRGKVIPVVDLRLKFGMTEAEHTEQTCIIVINVGKEIGIVVDAVSEVLDIPGKDIEPPPSLGGLGGESCILGMGKVGSEVKILLDIEKALAAEEFQDIQQLEDSADISAPDTN